MTNQGSGKNGEYTLLDILSIFSFIIGLQNYDMNVDQNDMQELQHQFNKQLESVVGDIHKHLQLQDEKIDRILRILNEDS